MRRRRATAVLAALLAAAVAAGCDDPVAQTEIIPLPTSAQNLGFCMEALITGRVVTHPAWGLALGGPEGQVTKVIWPYGYHGVSDGTTVAVVDEQGKLIARVGDVIEASGGFTGGNGEEATFLLCDEIKVIN